jgi:hypothetical protein
MQQYFWPHMCCSNTLPHGHATTCGTHGGFSSCFGLARWQSRQRLRSGGADVRLTMTVLPHSEHAPRLLGAM